jgi:hypothetical protein
MMAIKKDYIFTNKKHPQRAILSTILGTISFVSIIMMLYFTFQEGGIARPRYGFSMLIAVLFSATGLVLGILSRMEPDKFYFFSYLGLAINLMVLVSAGFILFVGAYGI